MLIGCQRDRGVEAGNDNYQPAPAPTGEIPPSLTTPSETGTPSRAANQDVHGELTRVDMAGKTITVRVENGMEQTFKWGDQSTVQGVESQSNLNRDKTERQTAASSQMQNLRGKEGSEVTVMWRDENGAKTVTSLNVTQMVTKNSPKTNRNSKDNTKGGAKSTY